MFAVVAGRACCRIGQETTKSSVACSCVLLLSMLSDGLEPLTYPVAVAIFVLRTRRMTLGMAPRIGTASGVSWTMPTRRAREIARPTWRVFRRTATSSMPTWRDVIRSLSGGRNEDSSRLAQVARFANVSSASARRPDSSRHSSISVFIRTPSQLRPQLPLLKFCWFLLFAWRRCTSLCIADIEAALRRRPSAPRNLKRPLS